MTLDPQVRRYLDNLAAAGLAPIFEQPLDQVRAATRLTAGTLFGPADTVAAVEDHVAPNAAGSVALRLYRPMVAHVEPCGALLWLHGGGWALGDLDSHDPLCRTLAARSGCIVVAADYRRAPEHIFPAAVEDAWSALQWIASEAAALGIDPTKLAVGGDSSGGNLAAAVARRARDADLPLRLQALVYPVADCTFTTASYHACAEGFGLTLDAMAWFWSLYAPGDLRFDPEVALLRAPSFAGVAPALVQIAEYDVLSTEGAALAARLEADGVDVTLTHYDGMIHGFFRMPGIVERAGAAIDQVAAAVGAATA